MQGGLGRREVTLEQVLVDVIEGMKRRLCCKEHRRRVGLQSRFGHRDLSACFGDPGADASPTRGVAFCYYRCVIFKKTKFGNSYPK